MVATRRIELVAFPTGGKLDPDDIAPGVQHEVDILGRSSHVDPREVLTAALGKP